MSPESLRVVGRSVTWLLCLVVGGALGHALGKASEQGAIPDPASDAEANGLLAGLAIGAAVASYVADTFLADSALAPPESPRVRHVPTPSFEPPPRRVAAVTIRE